MLLGLSTGNSVGLAVVAGAFVVFALASALLIPRRWPDFPGEHLRWFVVGTLVLLVGTLAAVEVFAKEEPEETTAGETTREPPPPGATTTTQETEPQPPPPPASAGDPAAGEEIYNAQGCGGCHVFSAAGSSGSIGPNLDETLSGKDAAFTREAVVDPNKDVAEGYQPGIMPQDFDEKLTPEQLDDLVAFLQEG